jgi:hypothetical protein
VAPLGAAERPTTWRLHVKIFLAAAVTGSMLVAGLSPAQAQVFGQFTGARPVPVNGHVFGGYLGASKNAIGVLTQLRLSFYPNVDFGFQGGLNKVDFAGSDVTNLRLGADVRMLVAQSSETFPVDLGVGGALGVETGDDVHILSLGPSAVASRDLKVGGTFAIVPYAGISILYSSLDIGNRSDTDVSFPLRFGTEFVPAQELRITAELQLLLEDEFNDDIVFATGVNLAF